MNKTFPTASTLADAVTEIERRFRCVPFARNNEQRGPAVAPNGEPYIELWNGQAPHDDDCYPLMATNAAAAAQVFLDGILRAGEGKTVLYWRIEPEMQDHYQVFREETASVGLGAGYRVHRHITIYCVYCRLAFA